MADSRGRLATLIVTLVLLTLFMAFGSASLALWLGGDWEHYAYGLNLTLKIMWGTWVVLFVAALLTYATIMGWRFRKARPNEGPAALMRAIAEGMKPSSWLKRGPDSFTITVVLVSLTGTALVASVVIWIVGGIEADWFWPSVRIILGTWWVLCIVAVLVRVGIFGWQRRMAGYGRKPLDEDEGPDDPEANQQAATEQTS